MRIICQTLDDFTLHLGEHNIAYSKVFVDRTKTPLSGSTRDAPVWEVYFQACAVLYLEEEGQALLEVGVFCGLDRHTADGNCEGSEKQNRLYNELLKFCADNRLLLRPGRLDF